MDISSRLSTATATIDMEVPSVPSTVANETMPPMLVVIAFVTLVLYAVWIWWLRPQLEAKKPFPNIPMAPLNHWFLGHIGSFYNSEVLGLFQQLFAEHADGNGRVGVWLGPRRGLAVTHWKDARTILHGEYNRNVTPVIGKYLNRFLGPRNLLVLRDREWRFHRSAVLKSFTPAALEMTRDSMLQVVDSVVKSLRTRIGYDHESIDINVETLTKMITLDVFGLAAFSHKFCCCDEFKFSPVANAFDHLGRDLTQRVRTNPLHPANYFYSLPTAKNIQQKEARALIRSFVEKAARDRMAQYKKECSPKEQFKNSNGKKDLLSHLLIGHQAATKDLDYDPEISDQTLSDIMMTLLFAGYDTTSITLTYALYLISQHPEIEANLLEEIEGSDVTCQEELVYCKAVLYETLRLYPSAPSTSRTLRRNIELNDGYVVEKGAQVLVPIWQIHRNPENFPQPLECLPERWVMKADDSPKWTERGPDDLHAASIPPGNRQAFLAFSAGGRNCPGHKFAWQEATLVLAGLLKHFSFQVDEGFELEPERVGLIQRPIGGLPMKVSLRNPVAP